MVTYRQNTKTGDTIVYSMAAIFALIALVALVGCTAEKKAETTKAPVETKLEPLQPKLDARAAEFDTIIPDEAKAVMMSAMTQLSESGIIDNALKTGESAIPFELTNYIGTVVKLEELLANGPVVLTFYRGGWCPFCNLQLQSYQSAYAQIKALGAELVAISPQLNDSTNTTNEKGNLEFVLLSDDKGKVADQYGLLYTLPADLAELYKNFGIDLITYNGTEKETLPLTATYIIGKDGKIKYSFIDLDYKKRMEPQQIIDELKKL